jgi:hypothetical protein
LAWPDADADPAAAAPLREAEAPRRLTAPEAWPEPDAMDAAG